MAVECSARARSLQAKLSGELDHHGAKGILSDIENALDHCLPLTLCLDFSQVTFMDSSGVAITLRLWRRMQALQGKLSLQGVPPQALRVFQAAGLDRLIPIK